MLVDDAEGKGDGRVLCDIWMQFVLHQKVEDGDLEPSHDRLLGHSIARRGIDAETIGLD